MVREVETTLMSKVPAELRDAFNTVLEQLDPRPDTAVALLDAIDRARAGLGVAIGRGATGDDERYEVLGRLVAWMYQELGCPQDSQHAVIERTIASLRDGERPQGTG